MGLSREYHGWLGDHEISVFVAGRDDELDVAAVLAGVAEVVQHLVAVGADDIGAQTLPDDVSSEMGGDGLRVATAQGLDPAEEDQFEVVGGAGHVMAAAASGSWCGM